MSENSTPTKEIKLGHNSVHHFCDYCRQEVKEHKECCESCGAPSKQMAIDIVYVDDLIRVDVLWGVKCIT